MPTTLEAGLRVSVTLVNEDEGYRFSETTDDVDYGRGDLYRRCVREYGRCTGAVYYDPVEGGWPKKIGWVFVKRVKYDDCAETFLQTAWVCVSEVTEEL